MSGVCIDGSVAATMPHGCVMTPEEQAVMERRVQAFIQWELNEFVRYKTGIVNFYGPCEMEKSLNGYEKES